MKRELLPPGATAEIEDVVEAVQEALGDKLMGVYLHGSAVMGCFNPETSDIDILAVCRGAMTCAEQKSLGRALLSIDGRPHSVEISILDNARIHPWRHPAPYEFHYSPMHRDRFYQMLLSGEFNAGGEGDPDLAAHVSVCRARGLALYGPAAEDIFDPVPYRDYFLSVADDFEWLAADDVSAVYAVLNCCRIMRLALEEGVYSKREGGMWALEQHDMPQKELIKRALEIYENGGEMQRGAELSALIDHVRPVINERRSQLEAEQQ